MTPMAWFKKKRSLRTSPVLIADLLYQNFVEEHDAGAMPEAYRLPEAVHERFRQKVLLYREANVLLALLAWAKSSRFRSMSASYSLHRPRRRALPPDCKRSEPPWQT
jgi:hypothetical protein